MGKNSARRIQALVGGGLAVALLATGGVLLSRESPKPDAITRPATVSIGGAVTVPGGDDWNIYEPCLGGERTDDIHTFAPVTITDGSGAVVARVELGYGTLANSTVRPGGTDCRLPFRVDVPGGLGTYGVQIGEREAVRYTEADVAKSLELLLS